jgi:hypothetical protein
MSLDYIFEDKNSMTGTDLMRALLLIDIIGLALLAIFYLRRRPISALAFLAWGLLAVLVPILGPFLVIAAHPGANRRRSAFSRLVKQR